MFRIEEKIDGDIVILSLSGNMIDPETFAVAEKVKNFTLHDKHKVIIDLKNVKMMNSCYGLGVIMACWGSLSRVGGKLRIINPSPKISNLFKITRLNQILDIRESSLDPRENF